MKRKLTYSGLWQQKRNELPVNNSADADWLQMRSILDKQMPPIGTVQKPFRFKIPKWGLNVFIGISASVAVYLGGRYFSKNHHQPVPVIKQMLPDSNAPAVKNSLPANNTIRPMSAPRTTPAIPQVDVQHTGQRRSGYPAAKPYLPITDSSERQMIPELSIRHDSLATPSEVRPQKLISDSMAVKKINIPRDTANRHKKPATKKRRRLSVFS